MFQNKYPPNEYGQSLVELSLFLLMVVVLLAGVLDFGNLMFEYQSMRDATQEGADFASLYPNYCDEIRNRIYTNLNESNKNNKQFIDRGDYSTSIIVDGLSCEIAWTSDDALLAYIADPMNHPKPADLRYHGCDGHEVIIQISHDFNISIPILSAITGDTIPLNAIVRDRIVRPSCPKMPKEEPSA